MMKPGMMQRTHTDSGSSAASPPPKLWRISSALKRRNKGTTKDPKSNTSFPDGELPDSPLHLQSSNTSSSLTADTTESNYRQLVALIQRMRAAPAGTNHVDAAYKEFTKIKEAATELCKGIIREEIKPIRHPSISFGPDPHPRRDSSADLPQSPLVTYDQRSSFSGRSLTEVLPNHGARSAVVGDAWLLTIRDWKNCVETLADTFKTSLEETYRSYERDATPEMVDTLFNNKRFRKEAVHRMRNASVTRVMSADPQFFPRYEIRFRNYERVKEDLREARNLVQAAESGITPDRKVEEFPISPKGDTVLEFANLTPEANGNEPVLRFRVSSHRLADTSPLFARMFSGHHASLFLHDDEDITNLLPPPPARYICKDGFEAKLYRMPQYETNHLDSLKILLHAAHEHDEKVPDQVTFEQFVAIAHCSMRYKSTSPLERKVEHHWLPFWMLNGADDMPDGLVVISYAFGLRQLFTRMSKSAILNLVDEKDLMSKTWPKRIRDKIWAVRCAKIDQVYECCTATIQEYIKTPFPDPELENPEPLPPSEQRNNWLSLYNTANQPTTSLTTAPRCPRGSHWCDASNLGWMMLVFNEVGMLSHMLNPAVTSHLTESLRPSRSLAQIFAALRRIPNPTAPIHRGGVCDPCPALRSALNDIFNSVSGLTLHEVSGKSHGWGLSKHEEREPQTHIMTGLRRMAAKDPNHSVATEFPEMIRLKILSEIGSLDDLHSAAMTNWAYYETYKTHELHLMRNILRNDRVRRGTWRQPVVMSTSNAEEKVLKIEGDIFKSSEGKMAADARTLDSDDDNDYEEDSDVDDGASLDEVHAPSIRGTTWRTTSTALGVDGNGTSHGWPTQRRRPSDVTSVEPASSPTTPRQRSPPAGLTRTSPSKPHVEYTEFIEPPMTHEEAQRILWPEESTEQTRFPNNPALSGVEGLREKFLVGDPCLHAVGDSIFSEGFEDKSLILDGEKRLRSEHDRRIGMLKKDAGAVSSSSKDQMSQG